MKKVVVFSPHIDDETLGAGGTLLKYKNLGYELFWIIFTCATEENGYSKEEADKEENIIQKVADSYQMKKVINLKLKPAGMHALDFSDVVVLVSDKLRKIEPNIVILPFSNDIHSDHRVVFDAIMSCVKAFRLPSIEKILSMEIISETDQAVPDSGFVPNYFVNIDDFIEEKINILQLFDGQILEAPFPRNTDAIRGLASYRAATCHSKYAEGFRLIREIEK